MVTCQEKLAKIQQDYADLITQGIITIGPNPCSEIPQPPTGDLDEFGTRMLHKVTGNFVNMKHGSEHRNGKRFNVNHKFQNYMMIGYYKTGKGQKQIEMKTDGPNHSGCTELPRCMWYEPRIESNGNVTLGAEYPHPDNWHNLKMDFNEDVDGGIKEQWIGYTVCAYFNAQNQRVIEQYCAKNPFDASGKPANTWKLNLKSTETGDGKMFPTEFEGTEITFPRELPVEDRGLEAEIRMHKAKKNTTDMKWVRVWELAMPVS